MEDDFRPNSTQAYRKISFKLIINIKNKGFIIDQQIDPLPSKIINPFLNSRISDKESIVLLCRADGCNDVEKHLYKIK